MGDISEMMLEGILCSICGDFLGEETGYPRNCRECDKDEGEE